MSFPVKNNVFGFPLGGNATVGNLDVLGNLHVFGTSTLDGNVTMGSDLSVTGDTTLTGNINVSGSATLVSVNVTGNTFVDNITIDGTNILVNTDGLLEVDNQIVLSPLQQAASYNIVEVVPAAIPVGKTLIVPSSQFGGLGTFVGNTWTAPYDAVYNITYNLHDFVVTNTGVPFSSVNIEMQVGNKAYASQIDGSTLTDGAFPEMYGASVSWMGYLSNTTTVQFFYGIFQDVLANLNATGGLNITIVLIH